MRCEMLCETLCVFELGRGDRLTSLRKLQIFNRFCYNDWHKKNKNSKWAISVVLNSALFLFISPRLIAWLVTSSGQQGIFYKEAEICLVVDIGILDDIN